MCCKKYYGCKKILIYPWRLYLLYTQIYHDMTPSQRILLNTLATYGRTIFAMGLGLFSSRWILQALGDVDFGLMGVVGALIVFITFFKNTTSNSCARFFAYSIGRGNQEEVNNWFNTALSVHILFPVVMLGAGYPLGSWMINNFFNIPADRLNTAIWVFRLSLVSAFTGMCFTPYLGVFTAKQRIYEMSVWGILQAVCMFLLAYLLPLYKGDCWLFYSVGTVMIGILLGVCQLLRARHLFPECRVHFSKWWNAQKVMELISFSAWQLFGITGSMLRGQGTAILLNKYFDPTCFPYVNAAYGVGNSVSAQTQGFSSALMGAFTPEITASEGRGNRGQMLLHANRASKFGTMLVLLFAIPLMLEIDFVLRLWLKKPPELAGMFSLLILAQLIIERLTTGQMLAVNAVGRIAGYQIMLGGFSILTLPVAWFFLELGLPAISVGWAFILTMAMLSVGRVVWAKSLAGLSPLKWLKEVFAPCLLITVVGFIIGGGVQYMFHGSSFFKLCTVGITTFISSGLLGWFVVLNKSEKQFFINHLNRLVR